MVISQIKVSNNYVCWACENCVKQLKSHGEIRNIFEQIEIGLCSICGETKLPFLKTLIGGQ